MRLAGVSRGDFQFVVAPDLFDTRLSSMPRLVPWMRREGGRSAPHEQAIPAGAYSDDTQLLLTVARRSRHEPETPGWRRKGWFMTS
jgi:hypothetical protein